MSAETKAAIETAIQAHVTDEMGPGHLVADWALITSTMNLEAETPEARGYHYAKSGPLHSAIGLADTLYRWLSDTMADD